MTDLIIIAIISIITVFGYQKGFVKSLTKLGNYIIGLIAASLLYPWLKSFLMTTTIYTSVLNSVSKDPQNAITAYDKLPDFLKGALDTTVITVEEAIANVVIAIISMILIFVLVMLILKLINIVLSSITKLPVISGLNHILGTVLGFFNGILVIYMLLGVLMMFTSNPLYNQIQASPLAHELYENNYLMKLIMHI